MSLHPHFPIAVGSVHFFTVETPGCRQLNPEVNAFQRKFVNEVRRCDEMERKLRYLEKEIKKDEIPVLDTGDNPSAPQPREMIDLEVRTSLLCRVYVADDMEIVFSLDIFATGNLTLHSCFNVERVQPCSSEVIEVSDATEVLDTR